MITRLHFMTRTYRYVATGLLFWIALAAPAKDVLPYKNPKLTVNERVNDLLRRMTLEEKVGQLMCTLGWDDYVTDGKSVQVSEHFKREWAEKQMGMLWATYRADPWTKKTLTSGLHPSLAAKAGNALQRYVIEHTRLGIPLFLAEEAPHGHMAIGTTVFPTGLAMAATWDEDLMQAMGEVTAKEIRLQGGHISYGPVLDLARDPRWSRVEETLGEDPVLSGVLGAAQVRGLGAGDLSNPYATLATLKHFIAYGTTEGGQNGGPAIVGQRELMAQFLPPFRRAIDSGALSVMTSYNSMDGIPSTINRRLLTDVLRNEWHFRGFVVSDLYSIDGIWQTHRVSATLRDAAVEALRAGVDVDLGAQAYATLAAAVRSGQIEEAVVDSAVARVLRLKMQMGLFERPYVDPQATAKGVRIAAHIAVAKRAAQEAVTLLKNANNVLPLSRNIRVAVLGPNADNRYNMLGDYTAPQPDANVKTILDGIRGKLPAANIEYVKGCAIRDTTTENICEAVEAARRADVVIVAVGGSSARDFKTTYQETGAAVADKATISDMECGEGFDRASLKLLGLQNRLLRAVKKIGKPMVVVYIEGRPLDKSWAAEHADALLTAYYPGQEGGEAIADVLFGDYNPAGRLPVSVPRSVGQLPVYYNRKRPAAHDYVELSARPLYPFGYGLSYTSFAYTDLRVNQKSLTDYDVTLNVRNIGDRDGDEVVQLYVSDLVASVVQPIKQLRRFKRVTIRKGETVHLSFTLTADDFALINREMKRVVESGDFEIQIGSSSDDIRLRTNLTIK
uniref:glycoside hydrolase family 3 N-terminal domain-containing protein n=2 Tax=Hoylesella enoeca TaxID=76123 RepID=UPI00288B10B2|nr:glycoside hydrolase family 3 N-terminal domain-containing protein [Hoylesella enoeca]